MELTSKTDSVIITTKGNWWGIEGISFENRTYRYYEREDDRENIDTESDSYSIIEECFVLERRDKNTLFVKINENNTGKERIMNITFSAGNYFDYVCIKQAP